MEINRVIFYGYVLMTMYDVWLCMAIHDFECPCLHGYECMAMNVWLCM